MKLRSQFIMLVAGIITAPFLVAAFLATFQYLNARRAEPTPDYAEIDSWIGSEMPNVLRDVPPTSKSKRKPPGYDLLVIGKDDTIRFSTITEFPKGAKPTQEELMRFMRENAGKYHFQLINMAQEDDPDQSSILLRTRRIHPNALRLGNQFFEILMYTSLLLLVFSALVSSLMLRSLTRSILDLELATRRVAGGDLDFKMAIKGRNEISSLMRSFDSMRVALKEEYARRARFIMGVSHDLKTPLALIQGYVEAIEDGYAADAETRGKYLGIVRDKTHALEGLVDGLIGYVKMDTGEWRLTHREVRLRDFLLDLARRYTEDALILRRAFSSSIDIPPDAVVAMDEGMVSRALENLIGNAIRYTEENGSIRLSACLDTADARGQRAVVSVSDTGIGIPQAERDRIFDPFYRGTNSRREQGFGLGLATVKSVIESHGWEIGVQSAEGRGTVFTIRVPGIRRSGP